MIQELRETAGELGCDAVYIENLSEYERDDPYLDRDVHQLLATCIVFTPPHASPANTEAAYSNAAYSNAAYSDAGGSISMMRGKSVPKAPFAPPLGPAVK
jgi:hypothetical protein